MSEQAKIIIGCVIGFIIGVAGGICIIYVVR